MIIWIVVAVAAFFGLKGVLSKKKEAPKMQGRPVETALASLKDVPVCIESFGNLYSV